MKLVDTHCHLTHESFNEDINEVIKRAEKVGFKAIVVSGVNPPSNKEVLALSEKYPLVKASLGIYPIDALGLAPDALGFPRHTVAIDLEKEFKFIEKNKDKIVSIGEVGMDFHWADKEKTFEKQREIFRKIIKFAIKINKPIVIHSRKAEKECIDLMEEEIKNKEINVVNHCFSGKKSQIRRAAELGHYFSVPPNIIRSHSFQTLVKMVPLSQLLTETDSPYLSPFPDKRNEPAFVVETIKKISEIKELSEEEVAKQIWDNYVNVFG